MGTSSLANDYLKMMLEFMKEAGNLSLKYIHHSQPSLKNDASVITHVDHAISSLAREYLSPILNQTGHLLIDEEDPKIAEYLDQHLLDQTPFLWALDPIDGTRLYANKMPLYGISLGLMKDLSPWLGVVYFPMLKELFFSDGENAYFVTCPFTLHEQRYVIKQNTEGLSAKSLFFCNDTFFDKFYWKDKDFHIMIHACAVVNLCWPTIGRGIGCFLRCHLWDFAGSWPIIQHAGFQIRRVSDGVVMDKVVASDFTGSPKPWQMKEYYLISTADHFNSIKSRIAMRES